MNGITVHPIADVHIGSKYCRLKEFKELLWKIKQDVNAYIILNGDLVNNGIKQSVSNIYDEKLSIQASIDTIVDLLKPVKERILGVVSGNHENRTYKEVGIDISKIICERLGIVHLYDPVSNYIIISFTNDYITDNNSITIYQTHGSGGGKTIGAKSNRIGNLSKVIHADVYIHSHTHTPIIFKENYLLGNYKGVVEAERLFVNTNAYEGYGDYGEVLGLTPSNHSPIEIKLLYGPKNKVIEAVIK